MTTLEVLSVVRDEGTIVVFSGLEASGNYVEFGVDHRPARDLAAALDADPAGEEAIYADVENWQII